MSTTAALVTDKTAWIRDLVFLAFPEGEARERVLILLYLLPLSAGVDWLVIARALSMVEAELQDHLQEGLLAAVCSGLSVAKCIPGMWSMAGRLKCAVPFRLRAVTEAGA